ncbi:hypothetical protein L1987_46175 [Smallanthus sonchifolius]|uniref:Uncharacterized protein n=1 Tax=Smallanthus sonchifolius TaxID=185202 RepID=A0ACB9FYF9_9ASTR|nr:hypothetical protein L1987_46175 [Smallanthus sonchifolius]
MSPDESSSSRLEPQATQTSQPHGRDEETCMGKDGEKLIGSDSYGGIGDSRGYDSIPQTNPNDAGAAALREEIEATCEMGNLLGVNLNGKEDLVRSAILGEVILTGYP